jgi:murein DD-endopeptidase MepM/ murein hydrolase activator NlpD
MERQNSKFRVKRICLPIALAAILACQKLWSQSPEIGWQPLSLVEGSPVLFEVSAPSGTRTVSGIWQGHDIAFFQIAPKQALKRTAAVDHKNPATQESAWYGLAGISVETSPGSYPLKLIETLANGESRQLVREITVARAAFPKITVKVARQYTQPSPEQVRQIDADKDLKQHIFASQNPERQWAGQFLAPVSAAISDVFGTERVFNGEVQSRHLGLDYAVAVGTPVHAINRGMVILARPLFFEGNCIVIDHGQGLLSLYLHLSEFKIKEGEEVAAGQLIGLSGGTGRATGPHLHLAVRWQGIYLNPQALLRLSLPAMPALGD